MASFISDAIFAGLKTQFENAMIELVANIAEGEGLDKEELMSKYLVNLMAPKTKAKAPAKPRAPRKAKVTVTPVDPDETQDPSAEEEAPVPAAPCACSCLTAKGKPCALKALPGTTMCRVHTKKAEADGTVTTGAATGPIKEKKPRKKAEPKPKKAKKVKRDEPVHTHELDDETHDDCELCQTHGCPLAEDDDEEYETVMSPPRSLRDRLARTAGTEEFVDDDDME